MRSCTRDSESDDRPARAQRAAAFELRQLSPALLRAAGEPQQREFFGGVDPRLRVLAKSPIDHAFVNELATVPDADRKCAVSRALGSALQTQFEAGRREIRIHTAQVDYKNTAQVLAHVDAARMSAALPALVNSFLDTGKLPGRIRRRDFDVEEDIQ